MSKHQNTYRKIFQASECPSIDDLFDYTEGKLDETAMHSLERHLSGCALCSDALEGYQHIPDRSVVKQQVVELGRRFADKAPAAAGGFKWGTLVAASVVVLISWGAAYLFMKNNDQVSPEKDISSATPAPAEEKNNINADSAPVLTITPSGTFSPAQNSLNVTKSDTVIVNDFATYYSYTTAPSVSGEAAPPAPVQVPENTQEEVVNGNVAIASPRFKIENTERQANYNRSYEDVVADDIAEKEEIAINEQQQSQKELEHQADTTRIAVNTPSAPREFYQSNAIGNNQKAGNVPQKKDKAPPPAEKSKQNDVAITQAMQYYNNGNYDLAISTCKKLLAENSGDQGARFYLGMSYRKLKEDDKAYPELSKITNTNVYYEEARWNMAMIDISKSRYESARKLLNEIVSTGKKYKEQAAAKLKEIEGK